MATGTGSATAGRLGVDRRRPARAADGHRLGLVERHDRGRVGGAVGAGRRRARRRARPRRPGAKRRSPITSSGPSAGRIGARRADQPDRHARSSPARGDDEHRRASTHRRRAGRADEAPGTLGPVTRRADHRRFSAGATDTRPSCGRRRCRAAAAAPSRGQGPPAPARPATACRCGCRRVAASPAAGGGWRGAARPPRRRSARPAGRCGSSPAHHSTSSTSMLPSPAIAPLVEQHGLQRRPPPGERGRQLGARAASARRDRAARRPAPASTRPSRRGSWRRSRLPSSSATTQRSHRSSSLAGAVRQPLDRRPSPSRSSRPVMPKWIPSADRRCARRAACRAGRSPSIVGRARRRRRRRRRRADRCARRRRTVGRRAPPAARRVSSTSSTSGTAASVPRRRRAAAHS